MYGRCVASVATMRICHKSTNGNDHKICLKTNTTNEMWMFKKNHLHMHTFTHIYANNLYETLLYIGNSNIAQYHFLSTHHIHTHTYTTVYCIGMYSWLSWIMTNYRKIQIFLLSVWSMCLDLVWFDSTVWKWFSKKRLECISELKMSNSCVAHFGYYCWMNFI